MTPFAAAKSLRFTQSATTSPDPLARPGRADAGDFRARKSGRRIWSEVCQRPCAQSAPHRAAFSRQPRALIRRHGALRPGLFSQGSPSGALRAALTAPVLRATGRRGDEVGGDVQRPSRAPLATLIRDGKQGKLRICWRKGHCNILGACSGPQTSPRGSTVACQKLRERQTKKR